MRIASLLLALPILAASCGGSADPTDLTKAGETSLGSQDSAAAAQSFDAALKAIGTETAHPMYVRAKLGLAEAFASTDPNQSQTIIAALLKELPGKVTAKEIIAVMNKMSESSADDAIGATIATLKLAIDEFPDAKAKLDVLGNFLKAKAEKAGDTGGASALDGLGYTGGD